MDDLETRTGLPPALRALRDTLPRAGWEAHPNFDGLTRFWLDRHLMFRDVLTRLRDGAEARSDNSNDPERHAHETSRYAGFLLNQLHGHHTIEDQHYFPQLMGFEPKLDAGFALLDRDHHALDGHIHALAQTTNSYLNAWSGPEAPNALGTLTDALTEFERFLDRHLTDEEDLIVPIILTHAPNLG